MKIIIKPISNVLVLLMLGLCLVGCDSLGLTEKKTNALGNRPDLDCIIANDFYAVHFSTYIQPEKGEQTADSKAAFVPYCQKIPHPGKMFFTADLIDRDIRTTPIAIRLVEVEKTGKNPPEEYQEISTVAEIPAKLYPRGAVEAQANIDKNGDYLLYLLIGDAIQEDDQFKVPLEVGVDPYALPTQTILFLGLGAIIIVLGGFFIYTKFKSKAV